MITAQDIREKTFEKAFNGYNMGQVDEFLDQISADLSAMAKENASLKNKMRVLVEKVEEYRQTEDSMRLALLSAQKMSAQIESDAQERADAILAQAKDSADAMSREAAEGIANEQAKLAEAQKATGKFFEHMRTVCEKQIEFYAKLSTMTLVGGSVPADAPAEAAEMPPAARVKGKHAPTEEDQTVKSIEESAIDAALDEPDTFTVDGEDIAEEEPTRRISDMPGKKRRGFDDEI